MSYGGFPYDLGYVAGIIDGEGYIRRPSDKRPCAEAHNAYQRERRNGLR